MALDVDGGAAEATHVVYSFKPYRNRNNPGDGPPRWGPLGRLGCLVLISVVVALLLMAFVWGAMRPDPEGGSAVLAAAIILLRPRDGRPRRRS